jgi:hypothetical protein
MMATLPVRRRLLIAGDGSRTSNECVFCPAKGKSISTRTCEKCPLVCAVTPEKVVCAVRAPPAPTGLDAPAAAAAMPHVLLVREDVRATHFVPLTATIPWLPVVSRNEKFLGFVSPDLLTVPHWPWHRIVTPQAGDVLRGASLTMLETEPLGHVLRFMARRGARVLALVDPAGVLQGMLSDVDALRAAARVA